MIKNSGRPVWNDHYFLFRLSFADILTAKMLIGELDILLPIVERNIVLTRTDMVTYIAFD